MNWKDILKARKLNSSWDITTEEEKKPGINYEAGEKLAEELDQRSSRIKFEYTPEGAIGEWTYDRNNPIEQGTFSGVEGKADKIVRAKKGKPIKEFKIEEESRDYYEVYRFKLKSQGDDKVVYEVTRTGGAI